MSLSKTARIHADRAVRSIVDGFFRPGTRMSHENTAATYAHNWTPVEATYRGHARNAEWCTTVEREAREAIEARIQSTAPNAANAAPLMPVCDHCPATEPYTVRYLTHCPGTDWHIADFGPVNGPDEARTIARVVARDLGAAFVHVQPSRLDFPPVISEEE